MKGGPFPFGVQMGEVLVRDDLVAVVGQALVERALGHQVPSHMASFQQRTLGVNPSEHRTASGEVENNNTVILPNPGSGNGDPLTFCSVT